MQSLKSIRLAEVDIFFKQSFEQKKPIPLYGDGTNLEVVHTVDAIPRAAPGCVHASPGADGALHALVWPGGTLNANFTVVQAPRLGDGRSETSNLRFHPTKKCV